MEETKRQLVIDLVLDRIGVESFVEKFGVDPRRERIFIEQGLDRALTEQSSEDVSALMCLAFYFGLLRRWASVFSKLLSQSWHISHEDIASALQDIRDPMTVDALFEAAQSNYEYLAYDDTHALAVKCIWALHDIGTEDAKSKLEALARSSIEAIRDTAKERLYALAARRPGEPDPPYRKARDASVRD